MLYKFLNRVKKKRKLQRNLQKKREMKAAVKDRMTGCTHQRKKETAMLKRLPNQKTSGKRKPNF